MTKINVTYKMNFVLGRVEIILGKGRNAGYHHFLLFPNCFQKISLSGLRGKELKVAQITNFLLDGTENVVVTSIFFFSTMFLRGSLFPRLVKSRDCVIKGKLFTE